MTPETVRAFQAKPSYDWEGKPLLADGIPGPKTRWALAIAELDGRQQAIVGRACHFVGVVEITANRHPDIDFWNERCEVDLGSSYCATFGSFCLSVPGMPFITEASAQALGKMFPQTREPVPGDAMWFPTGKWTGHYGTVIGTDAEFAACVEGNSGNRVRPVRRLKSEVLFGRTVPGVSSSKSAPMPPGLPLIRVSYEGTR